MADPFSRRVEPSIGRIKHRETRSKRKPLGNPRHVRTSTRSLAMIQPSKDDSKPATIEDLVDALNALRDAFTQAPLVLQDRRFDLECARQELLSKQLNKTMDGCCRRPKTDHLGVNIGSAPTGWIQISALRYARSAFNSGVAATNDNPRRPLWIMIDGGKIVRVDRLQRKKQNEVVLKNIHASSRIRTELHRPLPGLAFDVRQCQHYTSTRPSGSWVTSTATAPRSFPASRVPSTTPKRLLQSSQHDRYCCKLCTQERSNRNILAAAG